MARGTNVWSGSGNAGSRIAYTETKDGEPRCSFDLASESKHGRTWIRICVFGPGLVGICREKLFPGVYVVVVGKLVDSGRRMEVRAEDIVIQPGAGTDEGPTTHGEVP